MNDECTHTPNPPPLRGGATLLLVLGLVVIFANHGGHGIPPLYSAHSWMGVGTAVLMVGAAAWLLHTRDGFTHHQKFLQSITCSTRRGFVV